MPLSQAVRESSSSLGHDSSSMVTNQTVKYHVSGTVVDHEGMVDARGSQLVAGIWFT